MLDKEDRLLLASGSPRRREMVAQLGVNFSAHSPHVNEDVMAGEDVASYVERIAQLKMEAALEHVGTSGERFRAILTADTIVTVDGRILGKPTDDDDALRMLGALCGRSHEVQSCFCLHDLGSDRTRLRRVKTAVLFREATARELSAYVRTGEGRDKAGSYAIQGNAAVFVRSIHGSYTNVVGLPLCELVEELKFLELLE